MTEEKSIIYKLLTKGLTALNKNSNTTIKGNPELGANLDNAVGRTSQLAVVHISYLNIKYNDRNRFIEDYKNLMNNETIKRIRKNNNLRGETVYSNMSGNKVSIYSYYDSAIDSIQDGEDVDKETREIIPEYFKYWDTHSDEIRVSDMPQANPTGEIILLYKNSSEMKDLKTYVENINKKETIIEHSMISYHYYGGLNSTDRYLYITLNDWKMLEKWYKNSSISFNDSSNTGDKDNAAARIFKNHKSEEILKIIAYIDIDKDGKVVIVN